MRLRIRDLREDQDLRQIDVARATGIDQKTLSNYETGKTAPDMYSLIKLADFFDVSLDYLVGRNECNIQNNQEISAELQKIKSALDSVINTIK